MINHQPSRNFEIWMICKIIWWWFWWWSDDNLMMIWQSDDDLIIWWWFSKLSKCLNSKLFSPQNNPSNRGRIEFESRLKCQRLSPEARTSLLEESICWKSLGVFAAWRCPFKMQKHQKKLELSDYFFWRSTWFLDIFWRIRFVWRYHLL